MSNWNPINYGAKRTMEQVADGIRSLLDRVLVARTVLIEEPPAGSTTLQILDSLRFTAGEEIVLADDQSYSDDSGRFMNAEFHIVEEVLSTNTVRLGYATQRRFPVSANARIQKTLKGVVLDTKDIYYGDRETVAFDFVGICVEPKSRGGQWLAINGLLSDEWKLDIMVYVKLATVGENVNVEVDERAMRVVSRYADAIHDILMNNIHLDIAIDDVPLVVDAFPEDRVIHIPGNKLKFWNPDNRAIYEVQDNRKSEWNFSLPSPISSSSEFSSTESSFSFVMSSLVSAPTSSSSSSLHDMSSSSARSSSSTSSSISSSSSSSSSLVVSSPSYLSSESSYAPDSGIASILLSVPVGNHYRVADKAVLRRNKRYMYDSFPADVEYGYIQKGSYLLKSAQISWYGKETQVVPFPQVGKGGRSY